MGGYFSVPTERGKQIEQNGRLTFNYIFTFTVVTVMSKFNILQVLHTYTGFITVRILSIT